MAAFACFFRAAPNVEVTAIWRNELNSWAAQQVCENGIVNESLTQRDFARDCLIPVAFNLARRCGRRNAGTGDGVVLGHI